MAIAQRTATSGTAASAAAFTITLPTGTTTGDIVIVAVANAGTTGPAAPTGWTLFGPTSAGTGQSLSLYRAPYSAGLTLNFTNAASVAAWACNAYSGALTTALDGNPVATSSTTNNATLPTGAPTTSALAGDYEVIAYAWTSAATITTVATGSTIDKTQANSTSISVALGHNNTAPLGASTATTAFSQTLSASNSRKTGVGLLLVLPNPVTATPGLATLATSPKVPTVAAPRRATIGLAALTLATFAPSVTLSANVRSTPGVTAVTITRTAPAVAAPRLATIGAASLSIARQTPTVSAPRRATPGVFALALTPRVPSVAVPRLVTVGAAAMTITPRVPSVLAPRVATPGPVTMVAARFTPTIVATANVIATPGPATIAATPRAPSVTASARVTATPTPSAMSVTRLAPTVNATARVTATPNLAALTITRSAPTVTASAAGVFSPDPATLTLTRLAPVAHATEHRTATLGAAALTLNSSTPSITTPRFVRPGSATVALIGFVPTVAVLADAYTPGAAVAIITYHPPRVTATSIDHEAGRHEVIARVAQRGNIVSAAAGRDDVQRTYQRRR